MVMSWIRGGLALWGQRLGEAAWAFPDRGQWLLCGGLLGIYALIAIPWGLRSSLLTWDPLGKVSQCPGWDSPVKLILSTSLIALVFPALVEEILFRILPLPDPQQITGDQGWLLFLKPAIVSWLLFIAAHPLNAWVFFPSRKATFFNPIFLSLAALLGLICTIAYGLTASLWPPVLLHWLPVVMWLLVLGGLERMTPLGQ